MPKVSQRQQELDKLEHLLVRNLKALVLRELSGERDIDADTVLFNLLQFYTSRSAVRYWQERTYQKTDFSALSHMRDEMNGTKFKTNFRMPEDLFQRLVTIIQSHSIFVSKDRKPQAPVALQLLVCLKRLGCSENGAGIVACCTFFKISEGTIQLFTNRCLEAMLDLQSSLLRWPDAQERQSIARTIQVSFLKACWIESVSAYIHY